MKKSIILLVSAVMLPLGLVSSGDSATSSKETARAERERSLKLLVQVLNELNSSGQTNLASEVSSMVEAMTLQQCTVDLKTRVGLLGRLREGNTNVLEMLEIELDSSIVTLSQLSGFGSEQARAILAAKEYRTKYPRKTTNPDWDADVARGLSSAK